MDRATLLRRAGALLIAPSALAQLAPAAPAAAAGSEFASAAACKAAVAGGYLDIVNVGPRLWPELLENFYDLARRAGHDTLHIEGHGWRMLPEVAELDPHTRHLRLVS